jgi:hypothetical protein
LAAVLAHVWALTAWSPKLTMQSPLRSCAGPCAGKQLPRQQNVDVGCVHHGREVGGMKAFYGNLQGYCFPAPAFNIYFLLGRDRDYLRKLYGVLEAYDEYLWQTRDSDNNGVLEAWCMFDTGEDDSTRLLGQPRYWPHDHPPDKKAWIDKLAAADETALVERYLRDSPEWHVPMESMDVTAYSYDGRNTLAQISRELNNGIHVECELVYFSGLARGDHRLEYAQRLGPVEYSIESGGGVFKGAVNGRQVFRCTSGVRVVADLRGNVRQVVGIAPAVLDASVEIGCRKNELAVRPNHVYGFNGAGEPFLEGRVPFDYPFAR